MKTKGLGVIGSAGLGALLVYIFDPGMGRRRRALIADKMRRIRHKTSKASQVTARDFKNRLAGLTAESRNLIATGGEKKIANGFHSETWDVLQTNWSPSTRFIAGTFGAATALWGARKLSVFGSGVAALGGAIVARALTNMDFKRLFGVGVGRDAVTIHKIINIAALPEEVFAFWADYENFPRFMSNVRDVRSTGENRSHWVVAGPAGVPVEWDAIVTQYQTNRLLGWETTPESAVQHRGTVRFEPNENGGTRLDIRLSYNPIVGGIGHVVATLFGADPKSEMDQDLARMKTMIETGIPSHDVYKSTLHLTVV